MTTKGTELHQFYEHMVKYKYLKDPNNVIFHKKSIKFEPSSNVMDMMTININDINTEIYKQGSDGIFIFFAKTTNYLMEVFAHFDILCYPQFLFEFHSYVIVKNSDDKEQNQVPIYIIRNSDDNGVMVLKKILDYSLI